MLSLKQKQGSSSEISALEYLEKAGLQLVCKNFHGKYGEIDLIMRDKNTLVFIEVRYRNSSAFGGAEASVTPQKQQKIIRTAQQYLQQHHRSEPECRMDVVAIDKNNNINWIKNAFEATA